MEKRLLLFMLSLAFCFTTHAQWSLSGNSNATSTSKLGTTNSIPLNLVTNNATRLRIATDGKVGIGTTSPQQGLHVESSGNQAIFVNTAAPSATSGSGMIGYMKALPTGLGNRLGYFLFGSRGGGENGYNTAGMVGYAAGAWSTTSRPTYLTFETTPSGATSRGERVRITEDGNVGIGTSNPDFLLDVKGGSPIGQFKAAAGYAAIILDKANASQNGYLVHRTDGTDKWTEGTIGDNNFRLHNWHLNADALAVNISNNYVGIGASTPTNKLVVSDNSNQGPTALVQNLRNSTFWNDGLHIQAGTDNGEGGSYYAAFLRPNGGIIGAVKQATAGSVQYNTASDKRLKTNIRDTKSGLADVKKIQVKDYNFIANKNEETGFIAQQLYEVFPAAVAIGGDDPKTRPWMVDYGRLTPLLVKAVQELSLENEAQRKELAELKEMVNKLVNSRDAVSLTNASLGAALPNPVNSLATISYHLAEGTKTAHIIVTDMKGSVIRRLNLNGKGSGQVQLNTVSLAAGTYTYSLFVNGSKVDTKQLLIAR